jgi:hypothetical protein
MRGEIVRHIDGGGAGALVEHGGLFEFWGVAAFREKLSASMRHGNAMTGTISPQSGGFEGWFDIIGLKSCLDARQAT